MSRGKSAPRPPLSRERVVRAAVEFADREGYAALSMRKLADELGVVPMALYKHVADRESLVDAMVDAVVDEYEPAPADADWRESVRATILSARRALARHPWAREAIESRTDRTPAVLGYMESLVQHFFAGGFSANLTHHVMHALGNRIWGFSPEMFNPAPGAAPREPQLSPEEIVERFPGILAIARAAHADPTATSCDEDFEFSFALDILLDGFARLHDRGWTSAH
ncbi:MAG: TetR family transcriptional regulator [Propionibacterium sp.]|nr:TetR family transcriptional regulator [Propionibacterium sp.]